MHSPAQFYTSVYIRFTVKNNTLERQHEIRVNSEALNNEKEIHR